jgi:hypothetical protein
MTDSTIYSTSSSTNFYGFEVATVGVVSIVAIAAGGVPALIAVAALVVIAAVGAAVKNYLNSAASAREAASVREAAAAAQNAEFNQESMRLYGALYRALQPKYTALITGRGDGHEFDKAINLAKQALQDHQAKRPAGLVEESRVDGLRGTCETVERVIAMETDPRHMQNLW